MKKDNEAITFKELLLIFLPKIWIIILCGAVFAGTIVAYYMFLCEDEYTASTTIYVYKARENNSASGTYYDSLISEKMVKTYSVVLKSRTFLSKVVSNVDSEGKYGLTPGQLASSISIRQIEGTEVFNVYFTSHDKVITYEVLCSIAELSQTELKKIVSSTGSDVEIIDYPIMPKGPDSKHIAKNAIISFFIGVIISMTLIFVINRFDVVIHDKKKITDNFDLPILGVIPHQSVGTKKNGGDGGNV